jgi:hypothetical protein
MTVMLPGGVHSVGAYDAVSLTPFHFGGEFAMESKSANRLVNFVFGYK